MSADSDNATVVINVNVAEGAEDRYLEWEQRANAKAAEFPGYIASEIVRPTPGVQKAWTNIYRFDSTENLQAWLTSPERAHLIDEIADVAEDSRQYAMSGAASDVDNGHTLVVAHRVPPDREEEFVEIQRELHRRESSFPGYQGYELLRPVPGVSDEWTALIRFDSEDAVRAWMQSEAREESLRRLEHVVDDYDASVVGSSFGNWFSFSMVDGKATPNWKQWLAVLLALYPTVMILQFVTNYLPGGVKSSIPMGDWFFLNMWMGNFLSTLALTFVIMPPLTMALQFWLRPNASLKVTVWGTVLVVGLYVISILIFWAGCPGGCSF